MKIMDFITKVVIKVLKSLCYFEKRRINEIISFHNIFSPWKEFVIFFL